MGREDLTGRLLVGSDFGNMNIIILDSQLVQSVTSAISEQSTYPLILSPSFTSRVA